MKGLIFSLLLMTNVETVAVLNRETQIVRETIVLKSGQEKRRERRKIQRKLGK